MAAMNSTPNLPPLQFSRTPAGHFRLQSELLLPHPRETIFRFFSDAFQLETLTPAFLRFQVLTPPPIAMKPGTRIDYRLKLHGLPIRWQSLISVWEPPFRFIDEQTRGPYRRWHHEHTFEETAAGTVCRDIVDYAVWGGRLIESLLVRRDLERIFNYRQAKLIELFGHGNLAAATSSVQANLTNPVSVESNGGSRIASLRTSGQTPH